MSLGAARAGFHVVAGVDKDDRALKTHEANFPRSLHLPLDLSRVSGRDLLSETGLVANELDVLTGGPPCQGFSTMGKRNVEDTRNLLLAHFFRLINETRPRAFVLENVPGILNEQYRKTLAEALALIEDSYTVLKPQLVTACDVGAPTLRKRIFIVGFLGKDAVVSQDFWSPPDEGLKAPVVRKALWGLPIDISPDWKALDGTRIVKVEREEQFFKSVTSRIPEGIGDPVFVEAYKKHWIVTGCLGTSHSKELEARYDALGFGKLDSKTKSMRLDPNGYCPTLRAGTGPDKGSFQAVRPIHHLRPRVITPREAARLQGFPDWYQFDVTKWHSFRQIGNSVSPLVAEFVMKKVMGALTNVEQSIS
jgi:DNA (cytosine-5)-methyltransferase 1